MILIVYENILETIFVGLVYIKGNFLKLNDTDFSYLLKVLKHSLIQNLNKKIDYKNIDEMKYLKWCYDKLLLNERSISIPILKPGSIFHNKKIAHLSTEDYNNILTSLKKYYAFEN